MQRFRDRDGRTWDVVLGRESWGTSLALFVPVGSDDTPIRQSQLTAVAYEAAAQELNELDDAALQALLDRSSVKDQES